MLRVAVHYIIGYPTMTICVPAIGSCDMLASINGYTRTRAGALGTRMRHRKEVQVIDPVIHPHSWITRIAASSKQEFP